MPVGIRAGRLANARASALAMMPDTCQVLQRTVVGQVESYVAITQPSTGTTSIKCRLDNSGGPHDPSLATNARAAGPTMLLPWNASINVECHISHNGNLYELWDLEDDQSPVIEKMASLTRINPI